MIAANTATTPMIPTSDIEPNVATTPQPPNGSSRFAIRWNTATATLACRTQSAALNASLSGGRRNLAMVAPTTAPMMKCSGGTRKRPRQSPSSPSVNEWASLRM